MDNCSYCGAPLDEGRPFCSRCGKPIQTAGVQPQAMAYGAGSANSQQYYSQFNGQQNYNQQFGNQTQYNSQQYGAGAQQYGQAQYGAGAQQYGAGAQQYGAGAQQYGQAQYNYGSRPQYSDSYNGMGATAQESPSSKKKLGAFASGRERREARFNIDFSTSELLSDKAYFAWLGGTVLYALIVNLITCAASQDLIRYILFETGGSSLLFIYLAYIVGAIAGLIIVNKSTSLVGSFIGYNLIVVPLGFLISLSVVIYGGISSGVVTSAFVMTLIITMIMVTVSILKPSLFEKLGPVLLVGILALLGVSVVSIIINKNYMIWTYIGAALFSLYIGFDMYRASSFPKTKHNAINCAIDLYLDIINLFLRLLRIMAKYGGKRR